MAPTTATTTSGARKRSFVRRMMKRFGQYIGWGGKGPSSHKVRFQPEASVYEFERQLLGGGGVPDGDAVALGLGPRCVNTFQSPLSEKEDKDEYAATGYLDKGIRTKLLQEWATKQTIKSQLERARTEIERLHKRREETASSPRDQRYMPSDMSEAIALASQDELEAAAALQMARSNVRPRKSPTPGGGSGGRSSMSKLGSPICKQRR